MWRRSFTHQSVDEVPVDTKEVIEKDVMESSTR
jgi:hypothetical protein